jgi:lysophospholipase L1-like esterase
MADKNKPTLHSKWLNTAFNIFGLSLLLCLLLGGMLEIAFRIAGIQKDPPLFKDFSIGSKHFYITNDDYAKAIFRGNPDPPRHPFSIFLKDKPDSVFRIFVLGESSVAGFPYHSTSSFASVAEYVLQQIPATKKCEIINCGITAITSKHIASIADKLLQYQPDCIVIYAGHNEFYGIGGVGAGEVLWIRSVAETIYNVRTIRLCQTLFSKKQTSQGITNLLEQQAKKKVTNHQKDIAFEIFRRNITSIISKYHSRNIPVLLCTVVRNERNYAPFGNGNLPSASINYLQTFGNGSNGDSSQVKGKKHLVDSIIGRYPTEPLPYYLQGTLLAGLGKSPESQSALGKAIDFDRVPVRAPSQINAIIKELAKKYSIPLLDLEQLSRAWIGQDGIIDQRLLIDYIHFNYKGNQFAGAALAGFIAEKYLGASTDPASLERLAENRQYDLLDEIVSAGTINNLCDNWPFENKPLLVGFSSFLKHRIDSLGSQLDSIEKAAFSQVNPKDTYALYTHISQQYFNLKEYEKAKKPLLLLLKQHPIDPRINKTLGIINLLEKNYKAAYQYIKLSYDINPDKKTYDILKGFTNTQP